MIQKQWIQNYSQKILKVIFYYHPATLIAMVVMMAKHDAAWPNWVGGGPFSDIQIWRPFLLASLFPLIGALPPHQNKTMSADDRIFGIP